MEDAEEEKSVPPDLMQNTSHDEDGSGGKGNASPRKKKKRVYFDNEANSTGNIAAFQGMASLRKFAQKRQRWCTWCRITWLTMSKNSPLQLCQIKMPK